MVCMECVTRVLMSNRINVYTAEWQQPFTGMQNLRVCSSVALQSKTNCRSRDIQHGIIIYQMITSHRALQTAPCGPCNVGQFQNTFPPSRLCGPTAQCNCAETSPGLYSQAYLGRTSRQQISGWSSSLFIRRKTKHCHHHNTKTCTHAELYCEYSRSQTLPNMRT